MKMKYLSILILAFLVSCKANQQVKENNLAKNKDWSIESKKSFKNLSSVDIKITNTTKNNLVIFDPFIQNIEKYDGKNWKKIATPYCPCGNCPPPPETMPIPSGQKHTFKWDKSLKTCDNGQKISKQMESGRYRATFSYAKSEKVRSLEKLVIEFEI